MISISPRFLPELGVISSVLTLCPMVPKKGPSSSTIQSCDLVALSDFYMSLLTCSPCKSRRNLLHPHVAPGWDWLGRVTRTGTRSPTVEQIEEGLPEGEVPAVCVVPRADFAEKTQGGAT
jgi:hypothetical protein